MQSTGLNYAFDETDPYSISESHGLGSMLDQEPIKSPNTIVSDESIFTPDYQVSSDEDESSSEDEYDEYDGLQKSSNNDDNRRKSEDIVG